MKLRIIVLLGTTTTFTTTYAWKDSAVHQSILPIDPPPIAPIDPWQCVMANLTQYFDVPKPTGSLLVAIQSYADKLADACTYTDVIDRFLGCYPAHDDWCNFATAAPASVIPDYKLYGSAASAWWAAHSSNAVQYASYCPNTWWNTMHDQPGNPTWLNNTVNFAACYADAVTTTASSSSKSISTSSTVAATTGPGVTGIATPSMTPAPTNSVKGRGEGLGMWVMAGTGFAAAAANSM